VHAHAHINHAVSPRADEHREARDAVLKALIIRCAMRAILCALELFADAIARDFVPVDLGPSHRELPAQSFERRV